MTYYRMECCYNLGLFVLGMLLICVPTADGQSVRLSGGYSKSSGRVEVLHSGQWGTVCDESWDNDDAVVVCRMLGYSRGSAYSYAVFGQGSGLIWMSDVDCSGSESSLLDCPFPGWGISTCSHKDDAGVVCFNNTDLSEVAVRLVEREGYYNSSGRVEVFYDGYWGYIGSRNWGNNDAQVVCRMLGYSVGHSASEFRQSHEAYDRKQPTWMEYVRCNGSESSIADCPFGGWGVFSSSYYYNYQTTASVACTGQRDIDERAVRLVDGFSPGSGRLEVFYAGQWGTVCESYRWGVQDDQVVCRMLGYSESVHYDDNPFPSGTGMVWMSEVGCSGTESSLYDCPFDGWGSTCSHSRDVGVFCFNNTDGSEVAFRLMEVDGYHNRSGRVEVFYAGLWGYVGYHNWDDKDADVFCRMLGYRTGKGHHVTHDVDFGNLQHPTWMDYVNCNGTEITLADCQFGGWGSSYVRSSMSSASVSCLSQSDFDERAVRLVDGFSLGSGRLEVFYAGQWGTVCDSNHWGVQDDKVVCRMLGYSESVHYYDNPFPSGTGMVWMSEVGCSGTESSLYDCPFDGWGSTCSHSRDVGVFCFNNTDGSEVAVRLMEVDGYHNRSGRVEVFYAGLWGYVGYSSWGDKDADVVCRMLGYRTGKGHHVTHDVDFGNLQHPTWMDYVNCNGTEITLADCQFGGWGSSYVRSSMSSASVSCLSQSDFDERAVRLVDGFSLGSGRLEVFYAGQWGTVCDSYRWGVRDDQVVCRMLGYSESVHFDDNPFPSGTGMVWMSEVGCSGTESSLYDCPFDGWGSICSHWDDVGVFCFNNTDGSEVAVRLMEVDGYHNRSGRVEVFYAGLWGYVGYHNWDDKDADVVCRMLGYRTGKGHRVTHDVDLDNLQHPTWMNYVNCNGTEMTLADCPFGGWGSSYVRSTMLSASVSCLSQSDVEELAVRLVGGFSNSSGRVELFYAGEWGTICDGSWDNNDAQVVCRMLGYRRGSAYRYAVFGEGTGITWMSDVGCSGSESKLFHCSFSGWGSTCSHDYDVGVVCFNDSDVSDVKFRLVEVDDYKKSSGRIEVFYEGYWGYVGSTNWHVNDAHVACRLFGYSTGSAHNYQYRFEGIERPKPTWMDSVKCIGSETSLADCAFDGWGVFRGAGSSYQNCAFVKCTGFLAAVLLTNCCDVLTRKSPRHLT
ncbi:deleted in malignant brain tumors 1 protein-like isoform X2 [Pecten maximus]|uniref:deleted in malignant brain tumors 1 protein-like isoform X2 n=1 Tax=Pecten maximus TaxID=6579 RepID=UPI001458557C|nr:deleted in malignant brain tumors 1 protein-like isoform X2 [Pecten maximus]